MTQTFAPAFPIDVSWVLTMGIARFFLPMDGHDAEGRPLLEGRSLQHHPAQSDYRPCRYQGSRRNHANPMNVGGLRTFMQHRAAALDHLEMLARFSQAQSPDMPAELRLVRVAHAAYHAPKLWLLDHPSRPVPPHIAAAAKVAHGVYEAALGFVSEHETVRSSITAEGILDHAERSGRLIGRQEVCAGSAPMIVEVLERMLSTAPSRTPAGAARIFSVATLLWRAETLAHANAYAALAPYAGHPENDILQSAHVTFPNALEPVFAVLDDRPLARGFVAAYTRSAVDGWAHDAMVQANAMMERHPKDLAADPAALLSLRKATVSAFAQLDQALAALNHGLAAHTTFSAHVANLFFGSTQRPARLNQYNPKEETSCSI